MNGILKKALIAVVGLPLAWEGLQWAALRTPKNPPQTLTLRHNVPGFKPEVTFIRNKDLEMRSLNWTEGEKPAGALRVLCVGGESTHAQLQSAPETWWGQLHKLLEQKFPNKRIEIAANAVPLTTSLRCAKWVSEVAPVVKPDVIIANVGAQDLFLQPLEYKYRPNKLTSLSSQIPSRSGLRNFLLNYSQTARRSRASNIKKEAAQIAYLFEERDLAQAYNKKREEYARLRPTSGKFRLSDNDPRTEYLEALDSLLTTASVASAKLVLTGEPMLVHRDMELLSEEETKLLSTLILRSEGGNEGYRVESSWLASELRRFQEGAQEWATKNKVPFTDLNGKVPRKVENFLHETTVTDAGATVMAQEMLLAVEPVIAPLAK